MIQGLFFRRISRRLAEVEVQEHIFEAYISNGIDMDFLESGIVCFLREAENENRRTPFDLYSIYGAKQQSTTSIGAAATHGCG